MSNSQLTPSEYRKMLKFVAEKSKTAEKPFVLVKMWAEFAKEHKSKRSYAQLYRVFRQEIAPQIQKMSQFEMDLKVQILFAMACPIEENFLREIITARKSIEVDERNMLLTYSNPTTGLKISALNNSGALKKQTRGKKRSILSLAETLDGALDDDVVFVKSCEKNEKNLEKYKSPAVKKRKIMVKPEPVEMEELTLPESRNEPRMGSESNSIFVAEFLQMLNLMIIGLRKEKLEELKKRVFEAIELAAKEKRTMPKEAVLSLLSTTSDILDLSTFGPDEVESGGFSKEASENVIYKWLLELFRSAMLRFVPDSELNRKVKSKLESSEVKGLKIPIETCQVVMQNILYTAMGWEWDL